MRRARLPEVPEFRQNAQRAALRAEGQATSAVWQREFSCFAAARAACVSTWLGEPWTLSRWYPTRARLEAYASLPARVYRFAKTVDGYHPSTWTRENNFCRAAQSDIYFHRAIYGAHEICKTIIELIESSARLS